MVAMESQWLLWKSMGDMESHCCKRGHWLLWKFIVFYEKSVVAVLDKIAI
jgi:hypothetical protein